MIFYFQHSIFKASINVFRSHHKNINYIFFWRFYMLFCLLQLNLKLLFVLIVFGFIMGQTRHTAIQNFSHKKYNYFLLDFFNLVGTPVHELGHLLFGLLFGYKIDQICLYRSTKKALRSGGTLGFVKMHHENHSFLQKLQGDLGQFFIGIGPLLFGPFVIYIISLLLPDRIRTLPASFQKDLTIFLKALQELKPFDIIFLFMFLYIIIGISLNMELSRQDLYLACKGFIFLEIIFLIFSGFSVLFHWNLQPGIDFLFRWNLLISSIGIISALLANLISLI